MKNLILFGIAILTICVISCKKDSSDKKNTITMRGQQFDLSSGGLRLHNYGSNNYNFDFFLFTSGITIAKSESNRYELPLKGEGQAIYFDLYASQNNALDNGEYNFTDTDNEETMTVVNSSYALDYKDGSYPNWHVVTTGKISVSKNGDIYEITINCTDNEGKPVTGYYKGPLQYMTL